MRRILWKTFDALASFWLSITVLSFLLLLVVLGTLEQTRSSLYEVQSRYFESLFVIHRVGGVPLPLPGVYLLLVVLVVNLICGGIIRIRKHKSTWGVIVAHAGILAMMAGAAVEYTCSQKGHATIAEGAEAAEFQSYYDWEIAVAEPRDAGPVAELVVPGEKFMRLAPGAVAAFFAAPLPFELDVRDPLAHCEPRVDAGPLGAALVAMPRNQEAESDVAGVSVTVRPKSGGAATPGLLWARERLPMSVVVDGRRFTIELSHRRWPLPFAVRLDQFHREMHPGIGMAKAFASDVTETRDGVPRKVKISMNEPLRQDGYTLYQSGFIEPNAGGDGRWWSTFSVVKNPADHVPLWSCLVITAGLLLHFSQKLVRHVRTQRASEHRRGVGGAT